MDDCAYDPQSKQVFLHFGNVAVAIGVEDYLEFIYLAIAMKAVIEQDPDVSIGTYTTDEGVEIEEFIIKDENEEYS
jgi:hypothetical protein